MSRRKDVIVCRKGVIGVDLNESTCLGGQEETVDAEKGADTCWNNDGQGVELLMLDVWLCLILQWACLLFLLVNCGKKDEDEEGGEGEGTEGGAPSAAPGTPEGAPASASPGAPDAAPKSSEDKSSASAPSGAPGAPGAPSTSGETPKEDAKAPSKADKVEEKKEEGEKK
ncbi:hypothetical protein TELCIR_00534 [Teladorsagia circumcincta]|uniref:Uncharacterized protein n=1 Tax=Teladorsagia circumcincta TaxID=45464 RepID=A0A2G9V4I0_TELCI|nr:hypothetical protein TELCIR_00534 [Teladorsagia circumcincta]